MKTRKPIITILLLAGGPAWAQSAADVMVVVNRRSPVSMKIGRYYADKRQIPAGNMCAIDTAEAEEIDREVYTKEVERPVADCLKKDGLAERILYITTTLGVPLRVRGGGKEIEREECSVDSELTLLYQRMKGAQIILAGPVNNPFYGHVDAPFRHPNFPIYLVTRLAGYDFADVQALIDRAGAAVNRGRWVVDVRGDNEQVGNEGLRRTARLLPHDRVVLDDSAKVLYDLKDVIGYASWGFNDPDRHRRTLGFQWLPGAIATEFVSTNARTFQRPPAGWTLGNWKDKGTWFAGSPQDMTADFVHEGVTGVSGQVYEPFLLYCPQPNYVLPAYAAGRNLAESFYLGIMGLSWQTVVIGDPLCKLRQ